MYVRVYLKYYILEKRECVFRTGGGLAQVPCLLTEGAQRRGVRPRNMKYNLCIARTATDTMQLWLEQDTSSIGQSNWLDKACEVNNDISQDTQINSLCTQMS